MMYVVGIKIEEEYALFLDARNIMCGGTDLAKVTKSAKKYKTYKEVKVLAFKSLDEVAKALRDKKIERVNRRNSAKIVYLRERYDVVIIKT